MRGKGGSSKGGKGGRCTSAFFLEREDRRDARARRSAEGAGGGGGGGGGNRALSRQRSLGDRHASVRWALFWDAKKKENGRR